MRVWGIAAALVTALGLPATSAEATNGDGSAAGFLIGIPRARPEDPWHGVHLSSVTDRHGLSGRFAVRRAVRLVQRASQAVLLRAEELAAEQVSLGKLGYARDAGGERSVFAIHSFLGNLRAAVLRTRASSVLAGAAVKTGSDSQAFVGQAQQVDEGRLESRIHEVVWYSPDSMETKLFLPRSELARVIRAVEQDVGGPFVAELADTVLGPATSKPEQIRGTVVALVPPLGVQWGGPVESTGRRAYARGYRRLRRTATLHPELVDYLHELADSGGEEWVQAFMSEVAQEPPHRLH